MHYNDVPKALYQNFDIYGPLVGGSDPKAGQYCHKMNMYGILENLSTPIYI